MRSIVRFCLVAFVSAALCNLPARGGGVHKKVLGTVVQADRAHLDGAIAAAGADVYACDPFDTDEGGALRLQVGSSQLYLSALSAAALEEESQRTQVLVIRGTMSFSSPASSNFALETPAGILRADGGQAVAGQVAIVRPGEMVISAIRGDLLLDTWGEFRSIPEGKSAHIDFGSTLEVSCSDKGGGGANEVQHPYVERKIAFYLVATAVVGVPSYFLWRNLTESESKP